MNPTPDHTSPTEPGAEHLRRAIGQLPAHEPAAGTWARIETQLAADAALPRLVAELPTHEPDDALWASIAGRLAVAEAEAPRPMLSPQPAAPRYAGWLAAPAGRRALALAASLLLLVLAGGGWWQLRRATAPSVARGTAPPAGPRETFTVSEETVVAPLPALSADALERQGLAFIRKGCSRQPAVCSSSEFRRLNAQLTELQTQAQELRQAARRFGTSPELARAQTRLVNLQAAVERQLINLLIS